MVSQSEGGPHLIRVISTGRSRDALITSRAAALEEHVWTPLV